MPASTVHAVLVRCRINHIDRATGEPLRRYEHPLLGTAHLHTVSDDHARLAYT